MKKTIWDVKEERLEQRLREWPGRETGMGYCRRWTIMMTTTTEDMGSTGMILNFLF